MNLEMYRHGANADQTTGARELLDAETPLDVLPSRGQVNRRRAFWVIGGIAAVGVLVAVGAMLIPRVDPVTEVNAEWTTEPSAVSAEDLAVAVASCQGEMSPAKVPAGIADGSLLVAERRGNAVALMQQADMNGHGYCLVAIAPGSKEHHLVLNGWSGFDEPVTAIGPNQLVSDALFGSGNVLGGPNAMTGGMVGENVLGVTFHVGDKSVEASVENGMFLVWWPLGDSDSDSDSADEGLEYFVPDTGEEEYETLTAAEQLMTYDLHLKDGTTLAGLEYWDGLES